MKLFYSIILNLFIIHNGLDAQKLSIDYKTVHVPVTILPGNYSIVGFDDYKLSSANSKQFFIKYGMNEEQFLNSLPKLEGYNNVPYGEHFLLEIAIDEPVFKSDRVNTVKSTVDKKEVTTYSKTYQIDLNVTARILNTKGESILTISSPGGPADLMTTSTFKSVAELDNYTKKNLNQMTNNHVRNVGSRKAKQAMDILNTKVGFHGTRKDFSIYYIDTKKHPDYASCNAQYEAVRTAIKNFTKSGDINAYKNALIEPYNYFKDSIQKYNKQDPQEVKLASAYMYNTILLSYLGDFGLDINPLTAEVIQLEKLRKLDIKYIQFIQRQRDIMNDLGIFQSNYSYSSSTSKLRPGATGFGTEEEISDEEETKESESEDDEVDLEIAKLFKKKASDIVIAASLKLKDGKSIDGYLVLPNGDQRSECFIGAEFGFVDEKDKMKKFHIKAKEIESLNFAKRIIVPFDFKPYDSFGSKEAPAFAELLYSDDNIATYHIFVDDGSLINCEKAYHVFKIATSAEYFAVTNTDILSKKRAKKYFANCDKVIEYIDSTRNWYGNKEANINLAKAFSSCSN